MEDLAIADGRVLTPSWANTSCRRRWTCHPYRVVHVESVGPGPFGPKMAGELSNCAVAPAIANAVADAVGARIFNPADHLRMPCFGPWDQLVYDRPVTTGSRVRSEAVGTPSRSSSACRSVRSRAESVPSGGRTGPAGWPRISIAAFMTDTSNPRPRCRSS